MNKKRSSTFKFEENYLRFLGQLEIADVRLVSAKIDNIAYSTPPTNASVTVRTRPSYQNSEGVIDIFNRYNLTVKEDQTQRAVAKLSLVFCVTYSSQIPMTDAIFDTFKEHSLPVTTWPYFREFVHNTFARVGWIRLIPPAFKRGVVPLEKSA